MANEMLQALNQILQSRSESERLKVQQALAMMQFSLQKRTQDIQRAQTSLEVLGKMNVEYTSDIAESFMNLTGFGATVRTPGEGESATESLSAMTKDLTKERYGRFRESDAQDISAAVFNYRQLQDPSGIIRVLTRLGGEAYMEKVGGNKSDFLRKFDDLGVGPQLLQLADAAKKSTQNREDILMELD